MDRYNGDQIYPAAPNTAAPIPHLTAPATPPLAASQAASLASSLCIASFTAISDDMFVSLEIPKPGHFRFYDTRFIKCGASSY
ncbi:hypothetical protein LB506_002312 [Fusarium annulatum]|nr:hypothetical protein LB506_002312 [Fusarium annulatum]